MEVCWTFDFEEIRRHVQRVKPLRGRSLPTVFEHTSVRVRLHEAHRQWGAAAPVRHELRGRRVGRPLGFRDLHKAQVLLQLLQVLEGRQSRGEGAVAEPPVRKRIGRKEAR